MRHVLIEALRTRGVDVLTALEADMIQGARTGITWTMQLRRAGSCTVLTSVTFVGFTRSTYPRANHIRVLLWHRSSDILWVAKCVVS